MAKQLGVTNTSISNWENNISKPDLDMLSNICNELNVKASYFLEENSSEDQLTISEYDIITKYRILDEDSKQYINIILTREADKAEHQKRTTERLLQYASLLSKLQSNKPDTLKIDIGDKEVLVSALEYTNSK